MQKLQENTSNRVLCVRKGSLNLDSCYMTLFFKNNDASGNMKQFKLQFIVSPRPCYKSFRTPTGRRSHPEMFCKKGVLRNFAKFTGKHLCQSLFFNKVEGSLQFLRTPFHGEHLRWQLLHWSFLRFF